jgi:hypothetical protein
MPKIVSYEQQTRTPRMPGAIVIDSGRGEAMAAMGKALESVALAYQARDASEVSQGLASLSQEGPPLLEDLKTKAAPDASDFTPNAMKAFDAKVQEIEGGLTTRRAKQIFRQLSARERRSFELQAKEFEAVTRVQSRITGFLESGDRLAVAAEHEPEGWQERLAEQWQLLNAMGLQPKTRIELMKQLEEKVTTAAVIGLARRDPAAVLQKLSTPESGDELFDRLSLPSRDKIRSFAEDQLVVQHASRILQTYEQSGVEAGRAELSALDESGLPPLLRDEVRSRVNESVSRLREQRRQEHAAELVAIESAIGNQTAGAVTAARVEQLYDLGALSTQQYADYIGRIEASIVARAKETAVSREIAETLRAGLPLDPRNADHRKAVMQSFAQDVRGLEIGSPEWQATASAYAARTRMLPDQALAWTRQTTRSPDPKVAAAGAQFYGAIAAASPDAVGEIDADTKAFASTVNAMIEAGTDPTRAVETARATVFDLKPEVRKRREEEYREHAKQSDAALANLVDRDFDPGWFSSPPALSSGLAGDFAAQTERYFRKVGDIALARDLAWTDLKRIYGPSRVNGDPIMIAFPPERFGVSPEDVRTDIANFLKGNPQSDGSTADDIFVVPDAITMRQVNDALDGRPVQPSYKLVTKSGDLVLDRHGVPKRYTLPSGEQLAQRFRDAEAKAAAEAQALVEEARQRRNQERARRETWRRAYPQGK